VDGVRDRERVMTKLRQGQRPKNRATDNLRTRCGHDPKGIVGRGAGFEAFVAAEAPARRREKAATNFAFDAPWKISVGRNANAPESARSFWDGIQAELLALAS